MRPDRGDAYDACLDIQVPRPWAAFHLGLSVFGDFETALYFSTVIFSTLGYGDVVPDVEWRLFAALEGVNGFLLIGWSTAYLVAAGVRIGPFQSGEHF